MSNRPSASDRLRYRCYKAAVQDPKNMLDSLEQIYKQVFNTQPHTFREDFCGTFLYASEWVKRDPKHRAIGLDINRRPLSFGFAEHFPKLSKSQQRRLRVLEQNVLSSSKTKADLIAACNFSFYVLKTRRELLQYCRAANRALNSKGAFILEMIGGPAFEDAPHTERRTVPYPRGAKAGEPWFTYFWRHRSFNPVNREGLYTISFKFPDGTMMRDTFSYDWRVWALPEVRECMKEAGFDEVLVFWEDEDEKRNDLGTYSPREKAENDPTWICFVVGVKRSASRSPRQT